ncbi:DUF397 domain-containing protein [Streptomyces yaanensis]|uniref:DUF397 domain-containing protein n=1 Tax=Streptomyces yaanensis TaxID=1142239 RepID=A0ABV7SPZ7_9ACTN|nr:DUF397 domain-containing protein [Streptomyces sp. CGMCC 4.7035]WNC02076.1 DUF397 domain-containing protein [Streptomyces sp. CGMCC 4.7035]
MTARSAHRWFKSSYSGGSGTECVECAYNPNGMFVRDSKQGDGPVLAVRARAWCNFIGALSQGEVGVRGR